MMVSAIDTMLEVVCLRQGRGQIHFLTLPLASKTISVVSGGPNNISFIVVFVELGDTLQY